jgi:single-stranded DNA-binding protein
VSDVRISGYLTRDPELTTAFGRVVCDFNVAMPRKERRKKRAHVDAQRTYTGCRLWGTQAERFAKLACKGDEVHVEGDWWSLGETGRRRVRVNVRTMEATRLNVSAVSSVRLRSGRSQDAWSFEGEPGF